MLRTTVLWQLIAMYSLLESARTQFPYAAMPPGGPPLPLHAHAPFPIAHGPMPMPLRQPQMPVVIMPYRSKAADHIFVKKKERKPVYYGDDLTSSEDSTSDTDSVSSSEFTLRRNKRRSRRKKKREVLTPVISYVTRSGRVVYQKKIKKENPSDWLQIGNRPNSFGIALSSPRETDVVRGDITVRDLKRKYKLKKRRHGH